MKANRWQNDVAGSASIVFAIVGFDDGRDGAVARRVQVFVSQRIAADHRHDVAVSQNQLDGAENFLVKLACTETHRRGSMPVDGCATVLIPVPAVASPTLQFNKYARAALTKISSGLSPRLGIGLPRMTTVREPMPSEESNFKPYQFRPSTSASAGTRIE